VKHASRPQSDGANNGGARRSGERKRGRRTFSTRSVVIISVSAFLIVAVITGAAIYNDNVKPFRTVVLDVDGATIRMDYFLRRVAMGSISPISMLQTLTQEALIREMATRPPYNITVTEEDVDRFARDLARGSAETIGESELKEWYRQQENGTGLSRAQLTELFRTRLLSERMSAYLGGIIPPAAEQVFINMIPVKDPAAAAELKKKSDAGQGFAALAREYSTDTTLKENGGKVGWFPRGVLVAGLEEAAFALKLGQSSAPVYLNTQTVVVVMVSERAASRPIDAQSLDVLKSKALDTWYAQEYLKHKITFHGFKNGYDSATDDWVRRQLAKRSR
jgi:hypothetical protein